MSMSRIAVAGPSITVTETAGKVVEEGGSVIDAAIVATLTAMCTEPGVCAPGGGGFLTISIPGSDAVVIDGYMAYPGLGFEGDASTRSVTMAYGGGVTTLVGPGSVAVPGVFAGLSAASEMFGVAPWSILMEAVADTVEAGFPLGAASHSYLLHSAEPIFSDDPVVRSALFESDRLRGTGELIVIPGLADTLRHIGEEGADTFYRGDLARLVVSDLESRGGVLTGKDLAEYRAAVRKPLEIPVGDWVFELNPPPAIGGAVIALALEELSKLGSSGPDSRVEALVAALRARREQLETAEDVGQAVSETLLRAGIMSPSTISVAATDADGGAVASTFSAGYGSGVVPSGTGMLMNNALGEVELLPRGADGMRPGSRMMSNMAPTVGRRGPDTVALGSPGADRITTAVFSTINSLVDGLDLAPAIDAPRAHPEFDEDGGLRIAVEPGLELAHGRYPVRRFDEAHMYFGGVNGTAVQGGRLTAHADIRRSGAVAIYG